MYVGRSYILFITFLIFLRNPMIIDGAKLIQIQIQILYSSRVNLMTLRRYKHTAYIHR